MRIAAVAIQRCHTNSPEDVYVPHAKKQPHFVDFLLKLHATAPVRLCPNAAATQNPQIHPIQDDGLKQPTTRMHTGYVESTRRIYILTKTSSRDHGAFTLTRTADKKTPRRRTSRREETFSMTPRFGSTTTTTTTTTMPFSQVGYSLFLTTKGDFITFPDFALLKLDSWYSPHNPAILSLASPTSDVGRGEKVCCPGSTAKLSGDQESA